MIYNNINSINNIGKRALRFIKAEMILLVASFSLFAYPMQDGTIWIYWSNHQGLDFGSASPLFVDSITNDSVIKGNTYKKVIRTEDSPYHYGLSGAYCIRVNADTVFAFDSSSGQDKILYNFALQANDTTKYNFLYFEYLTNYPGSEYTDFHTNITDSIITMDINNNINSPDSVKWKKGIGQIHEIQPNPEGWDDLGYLIACIAGSDTLYQSSPYYSAVINPTKKINIGSNSILFKKVNKNIELTFNSQNLNYRQLKVFDVNGRIIFQKQLHPNQKAQLIDNLPNGILIFELLSSGNDVQRIKYMHY